MNCEECRALIDARLDGELPADDAARVDAHLAACAQCRAEYESRAAAQRLVKEHLVRHEAPDLLRARIRGAIAAEPRIDAVPTQRSRSRTMRWAPLAAAALVIAVASSAITLAVTRPREQNVVTQELLASHVRSLMPGHLTDVLSSAHHTVKPWFNGRVDMSPAVPNLDSSGFPLVGGRTDYVHGRTVPVVVYARRQHLINVYAWPEQGSDEAPSVRVANGYHFVEWKKGGIEYWAVSDLNVSELESFVARYSAD